MLTPLSLVASLDPERLHYFFCIANGSGRPDVEIDGLFFNHQAILARGITVTLVSVGDLRNATISIPATIDNNDTRIQCLLGTERSPIGRFFVQGKYIALNSNDTKIS